ncbi:MRH domain-containing protein [Entamoeba marina]
MFPDVSYNIIWDDVCLVAPPGELYNVTYMKKNYSCIIPKPPTPTENELEEFRSIQKSGVPCFSFNNGYYNYVLCPGHNVTQQRFVNGHKAGEILLGNHVKSVTFSKNSITEEYDNGSLCLGSGRRSVMVEYFCLNRKQPFTIFGGLEEESCKYHLKWQIPKICEHQAFVSWNVKNDILCCHQFVDADNADMMNNNPTITSFEELLKMSRLGA